MQTVTRYFYFNKFCCALEIIDPANAGPTLMPLYWLDIDTYVYQNWHSPRWHIGELWMEHVEFLKGLLKIQSRPYHTVHQEFQNNMYV